MTRILSLMLLLVYALSAQALVSLDPADYADGTDVSAVFDGVQLGRVEATSNVVGTTVYSPLRQIAASNSVGQVYASSGRFSRLPNTATLWSSGTCCSLSDALRIDFIGLATGIAVSYLPDDGDTGLLAVFGPSGEVLADLVDQAASPFILSYTSSDVPIAYALVSFADTGHIGAIRYEAAIPAPSSFALIGLGLAGLGFSRRKQ